MTGVQTCALPISKGRVGVGGGVGDHPHIGKEEAGERGLGGGGCGRLKGDII